MKKIAIIGAGLQAQRRIPAFIKNPNCRIVWIVDLVEQKAKKLAGTCGAQYGTDWKAAIADKSVDIIVVLTYPDTHAAISIQAMKCGKDVLCEKPLARTEKETSEMFFVAKKTKKILHCGFNHRYHPAISHAHELFNKGKIGKPIFGRGIYGIAGRVGLEKEWRSDPSFVGGGQLMEQGIHLIDLFCWFLGKVGKVTGFVDASYWPIKPLEDNGFALLKMRGGTVVSIHSSLTQWINKFEFELYGEKGSLTVRGLGGSYGVEKLIISTHDSTAPFSYETVEYRGSDISWEQEWNDFMQVVKTRRAPTALATAGLEAIKIVNAVYTSSKTGRTVVVNK